MIKKALRHFFTWVVKKTNLGYILSVIEEEQNVSHINSNVINNGARFFPSSVVQNFKRDPNMITIGQGTLVRGELVVFPYGGQISIGDNCYVGEGAHIWSGDKISIGNNVLIGHNVNITDFSHRSKSVERAESFKSLVTKGHPTEKGNIPSRPIIIEDDVIIYAGASIVMGVTIGKGSIISTGSVVIKDIPPFSQVIGNPAKIVWRTK